MARTEGQFPRCYTQHCDGKCYAEACPGRALSAEQFLLLKNIEVLLQQPSEKRSP
jgi:hypothetical protein